MGIPNDAAKRALQPYCVGGPWGRLLDAEAERLGKSRSHIEPRPVAERIARIVSIGKVFATTPKLT